MMKEAEGPNEPLPRHFKLVSLHDRTWLLEEFLRGRARFGWSGPHADLRRLHQKRRTDWSDEERVTWRYTKFLLKRIRPGHRVVLQFHQPIREFVIGEVEEPGYDFDSEVRDDFNHILHVKPLTPKAIDVNSAIVSKSLKHDLTKRGHYYEIYPRTSLQELVRIVDAQLWLDPSVDHTRTDEDELDATREALRRRVIKEISQRWKSKNFEVFCQRLCREVDFVEVSDAADRGRGWDFLLRIVNPITHEVLLDDVPVQCKNYSGKVRSKAPLGDLERSVKNSDSHLAYLFVLGDLTDDFWREKELRQLKVSKELGRDVDFVILDQERIADLYLEYLALPTRDAETAGE